MPRIAGLGAAPLPPALQLWRLLVTVLLLSALLLACCPVPSGASSETVFAAEIASVSFPSAWATLADGSQVRLSLANVSPPVGLAAGQRVYVEGEFSDNEVLVGRIALL